MNNPTVSMLPNQGGGNPAFSSGFDGMNGALKSGELKKVQGIMDISEEALNSVPDKNSISLE